MLGITNHTYLLCSKHIILRIQSTFRSKYFPRVTTHPCGHRQTDTQQQQLVFFNTVHQQHILNIMPYPNRSALSSTSYITGAKNKHHTYSSKLPSDFCFRRSTRRVSVHFNSCHFNSIKRVIDWYDSSRRNYSSTTILHSIQHNKKVPSTRSFSVDTYLSRKHDMFIHVIHWLAPSIKEGLNQPFIAYHREARPHLLRLGAGFLYNIRK